MKKVQITLDDKLLERIDNFSDANYMSRSGFLSFVATQYLNSNEIMQAIKDIAFSIRKMADTNKFDEATMDKLRDFEVLCKMFNNR